MPTIVIVLIIIAAVVAAFFIAMYFLRKRIEKQQAKNEDLIRSTAQQVSVLVIDKKKLRIKNAGLPDVAMEGVKWYQKIPRVPVVKIKVQSRIMNVLCDNNVFEVLPVKSEAKVIMSGLYITEIRSVRGGSVPQPEKKTVLSRIKGIFKKN